MNRSESFSWCVVLLVVGLFTSVVTVFADAQELTPEETVLKIIEKLKQGADPAIMVDYVDWSSSFAYLTPEQRQALRVRSPDELREFYREVFHNPLRAMNDRLGKRLQSLPPQRRDMLEAGMKRAEEMLRERQKMEADKLARTEFKVLSSKRDGTNASVEIESTVDGETKTQTVHLVKMNGRWLFPTIQMVRPQRDPSDPTPLPSTPPVTAGKLP